MKAVNLRSLISVYAAGNADLFAHYVLSNGISDAQRGLRTSEMDDIVALTEVLEDSGAEIKELDNFYIGYSIPQIGKEFDLLRFGVDSVMDIEIKQTATPDKVEKQLSRNAYYLSFLDCRDRYLYSYVCDRATLYRWNGTGIEERDISDLVYDLEHQEYVEIEDIDKLFDPTNYLVSPFNSTDAFVEKRYFLTKHQEEIKRKVLAAIQRSKTKYLAVTGRPGTGKTLLLYDIVAELRSLGKRMLVLHCAALNSGQTRLVEDYGWTIKPAVSGISYTQGNYDVIVVDEAQRIKPSQLNILCACMKVSDKICLFSYDDGQCLSYNEISWEHAVKIEELCDSYIYKLTEKIRTNKEIAEFILYVLRQGYCGTVPSFPHVTVSYCAKASEAKEVLMMYKSRGWKVPVYTPGMYSTFHYEKYNISDESAHGVIGQEFDDVVAVIDNHFYYDAEGRLATHVDDVKLYSQIKMFYQIVTRTRKRLHILVFNNPTMMSRILSILSPKK